MGILKILKKLLLIIVLISGALFLSDIIPSLQNKNLRIRRNRSIKLNKNVISIACVIPKASDRENFINGLKIAQQEINTSSGNPFTVYLKFYEEGKKTALEIVRDTDHSAVIGYSDPNLTQNAGMLFTENDLLFFHYCTSFDMKNSNIKRAFSLLPSDKTMTKGLIKILQEKKLTRPYIIVSREKSYNDIHLSIYPNLIKSPIKINGKFIYQPSERNFDEIISDFTVDDFDNIIFIGEPENCVSFLHIFRSLGFEHPIFYLESPGESLTQFSLHKKYNTDVNVLKAYNPIDSSAKNQEFVRKYANSYDKQLPTQWSALAFESLMVLGDVVKKIESKDPLDLANYLYFHESFVGLTDTISFNKEGFLNGKSIFLTTTSSTERENSKIYIKN